MATEIDIPVSVSSKQGERENDAFSSEFLEGKVTEYPGNKVQQLESGSNQPLETSSHVVETVNTQLESDKRTDEGGIFFQALSVPVVTADEHINTPDSCETTTREDQEDRRTTKIETFTEGKPNDDERVAVITSKEREDHNVVEAISAQTKGSSDHVLGLIKGSDEDIKEVTEFSNENESMGGSSNGKTEAGKEEDLQGKNYNSEGKEPEIVKIKENVEEDNEEIRPSLETEEKTDEGLRDGITTDVCVSTQTKPEEGTTEKAESEEGLEHSDIMAPIKQEIASKDEDQEKEHAVNMLKNDQGNEDDVISSQDATCEDINETTTNQHATTVAYLKEQDLNETPKEILKEETEAVDVQEASKQCENGARGEREQKPVESVNETVDSSSEIEQEEQTEVIRPIVEIEEEMEQKGLLHAITSDSCISTQTKSQVENTEHEEKDEKEAAESDDGRREKSDIPSVNEVCEETAPEKVESEKEVKLSESSGMNLEEKAIAILNKDDDQEKEQEIDMSENGQGEDNITNSQDVTFEGGLQSMNHHNEPELVETKEVMEEDTEETEYSVKPLEKADRLIPVVPTDVCISTQTEPEEGTPENKERNDEEVIGSDDDQRKKSGSLVVKEVCEEVVSEKAESEEVSNLSDNFSMALNENVIASKDEDQELYVPEKGQGGGDDVTSSQNASSGDITEATNAQHATTPAYFEEGQDVNAMPEDILKEEEDNRTIDPQEESEQCENEAKDEREQKPEESVNKIVHSCLEIEQEEDTEEIKPTDEKPEQQGLLHVITTDACISTQTKSHVESAEHEENNKDETIESDDGRKEKSDNPSVRKICEETGLKIVESEGVTFSDNSGMKQDEKAIAMLSKDEDQEKEHKLNTSEKDQGEDDVACPQDSTFTEDLQAKNNDEGRKPKFVTARESIEVTEEIRSSVERKEKVEQQGVLHAITTEPCISTETESRVGTTGDLENNEEKAIESDEVQKEISESPLSKEACEDTALEKVENEEVIHSDSSNMKLDEKVISILCKDEDQETEQKVNMSEKDKGEDDVTSLHEATIEGGLQEKNHHSEGNEPEVVRTKEGIEEDTEEIISNVETIEKIEQQRLIHVKPKEATTEEKNDEEAIESDDGQTEKSGSPMVEVCEETVPEKADEYEEGLLHSDSSSTVLNENEIAREDKYQKKEQELYMSEKSQGGGDDVTCSQNASNADTKEMIGEHATKVAYFEELQGINAMAKDPLKEEANDRTIVPQQASEQYEDEANSKREQKPEENIHSCSEIEQEEYGKEIKPSDETEEVKEEQEGLMHISTQTESQVETGEHEEMNKEEIIECDDGRKEKSNNPSIKEVCEEIDAEKVEYEGVEHSDNSSVKLNEKAVAILSKDEDQEKEQEFNMSEQEQHEDDVPSSQDATSVEHLQAKNHDGEGKEPEFVKTRESTEEDNEEVKSSVESKEKVEPQGLLHAITTDVSISTQTKSQEIIESNDGRKEKSDNVSVKEVSEEGIKLSDSSDMELNEKAIEVLSNDEDQEKEQELDMPKVNTGEDEVTCSQDASSKKDLEGENHDGEHIEPELVENREIIKEDFEVIRTDVKTEESKEQQGSLSAIVTDDCMSAQTESKEETTKDEEKNEESVGSSDGRKEKLAIPCVNVVCEETGLKFVESKEEVKLFDSSTMKQNEQAMETFKDDHDKDQEVNLSAKGQGKDNVTSSQEAASEEDLQEKDCHNGDDLSEFVKTRQTIEKDIEAIGSNVETIENSEQQELLQVITTDVCNSTQTRNEETAENEEKNDEEAIENDDGRTKKSENPLIKEVYEAIGLQDAEFKKGVKVFDSSSITLNKNKIANKDEDQEKEQELKMSEEVQGGGDDVLSSQSGQNEDIKETTSNQNATTMADFEEQCLNERPKEILKEETKEKSIDAQEASEQDENGAKNKREQGPEGSANKPGHSHSEIGEATTREDETDAGNKEEEYFEKLIYEAGEAGDGTECKPADGTQNISPENKDDTSADESKSTEGIPQFVDMSYDKASSPFAEETEDEKLNKKEEWYMDSETHMQKGDVSKKVDQEDSYATHEQKSIDTLEQESISDELQARVEKEFQEDSRGHQLEDSGSENPCTTGQDILEEVGEKTTMTSEKITKQAFQESQSETNKELEAKLDAENQADRREDRSERKDEVILTEKMSSKLGQPMEQNVEEIQACQTTTMSEKTEDEIAQKDEDLSLGSIEDTNDNTTNEEKSFLDGRTREIEISALEHEPAVEKMTKQAFQESESETNKEIEAKLDAGNQAGGKEDRSEMNDEVVLTEKMSLELGKPMEQKVEEIQVCQTTTMSEKTEDEIAEKDEDLSLGSIEDTNDNTTKDEKSLLDGRTREIEISTLEHEPVGEKITKQAFQESERETNKEIEAKLDAENQAGGKVDRSEMNEVVLTEKMSSELGQPMEQNAGEIQACQTKTMRENTEDEIAENDEDLSRGSIEDTNDNTTKEEKSFLDGRTREIEISTLEHESVEEKNGGLDEVSEKKYTNLTETTAVELQEDIMPSRSLETSTEDTPNSEKSKAESENLPIEDFDSVSEIQIPRVVPKSEDSNLKEECLISATAMSVDEERGTVTKEISSDEISYSDPIPVGNPEVTEVRVEAQIRQEDLQAAEDISCESKASSSIQALKMDMTEGPESISGEVKHDAVDEAPKRQKIPILEDAAKLEPQVDLSNIESTYPSKNEKSPMQALESVCDVQTPEVVPDSEESKVKEERIVFATAGYTDENNGEEEQEIKINEISSAEKKEQTTESKQVVEHPPMACPDAVLIEENLELYGELKPTSELMIDEDRVNETKPQPEQSDITSENIMKYQTLESKLEHTSEKDLNRRWDMEEDVTLAPENQINSSEDQNETMKNVILTEKVVVETEKEEGRTEVKGQDSEEDNCPTELETTSISNQKELANEIEYSMSIPIGNTEVADVKAESQRELKTISEDLSCLSKASSTIGASKVEMNEGTGQTVTIIGEVKDDSIDEASRSERVPILEDAKALELQVNLPEIKSIDTSSNDQDGMKLREGMLWSTQETIEQKGVLISQLRDREILEEEATENRKEAPDHEFEKEEKDDGLISEIQTPEAILKTEMKEEHLQATDASCETLTGRLSSDKLLDELNEVDAKEDTEIIVGGEEKAAEDSYQDAVAEVTAHDCLSQTEEKLVSMVPPEELTSPTAEDQTNELVSETDKTKVEHSSISNKDQNPELMEKEFTKTLSDDQRSIKKKYIEEEGQGNFGVENKEAKSGNEVAEDVIVNEVLLKVEKAKESDSTKDSIGEEGSCIPNQLTSATDEVCQIRRLNSSPNELLEAKGSVEDIGDPKSMDENLNLKDETFTVMKGPNEDKEQDVEKTSEIVASEFERLENMVTEEKMIEADARKEKETLDEPQAGDPAKTTSDSILSATEQDKDVRSEESRGDMHKLEEEPTEVFEHTSEVDVVVEGKEVSAKLTENLQEASPEMLLVKHDTETTATTTKIEEEIKDKDETLVNMDFSTSTKEVACLSNEKTGELQVSTLKTETDEGKQDGPDDMLDKEREAVQPHEHISNIEYIDPPSDVEIREQGELMHCGSQEPSEDNALLSQNDKKIADLPVLPSAQKEIIQDVDKRFEEPPAIDNQKHENDFDYTAKATIVDVVSNAECPEIELQHLDSKEATVEPINQENQSEQKKEADGNIEGEIPNEKVPKQTAAHKEIANEFLVMPVAKEEENSNYLQDHSKEQEYSGERTYQDLEAVKEPSQTDELSDKVKKAEPVDIQEETMAGGNLREEETEKRTNITEATVNLHHREKGDETNCKATSTDEYVKSSDVELKSDMDVPVPMCASTRNPEVRSAILEVLSVMDATAEKAGYNKDPTDKTAEAHVAEKGVLKEDVHLESTCNRSKTTEKVSGTNQEPLNLPLTKERSMELDAPVTPGTAATEDVEISQKNVTDDLIKISQIQPELQKNEVSACTVDKQLLDKSYQNESMESKLLTRNMDASHEQGEPTANSLNAKAKDLNPTNASDTKPQYSSEVVKEEKKISDEKKKSETPEPATVVSPDTLHELTQGNSEVAENLIEEREPASTKDQQVDKEETGDNGAKTDDEDEAEEDDDEDYQKMGSCSDAPVMIEASKDMEVKVHKKSHNILSGVGSKVKHSIAKVKKAITGKSSHPKPPSPKERD